MKLHSLFVIPAAAVLVIAAGSYPSVAADATKTVQSSTTAFQQFMTSGRIPPRILRSSQGLAIIPNVIQAGFFLGGQRGQGVMVVRNPDGGCRVKVPGPSRVGHHVNQLYATGDVP